VQVAITSRIWKRHFVLEKIGGWFIEAEMKSLSMMRSVIDDVDPSPLRVFVIEVLRFTIIDFPLT
jgi:hypothetical protein